MREIGRGAKVFDHEPVRGTLRHLDGPDDVLALMDAGAEGLVALVRDAGATFLAPLFHQLTGIVCTSGTPRSHIGIISREFQVPCVTAVMFDCDEPATGTEIEVDCAGPDGVLRG
jgi:phosphoenolpyruvate-protein kinase (PTS system EI component)